MVLQKSAKPLNVREDLAFKNRKGYKGQKLQGEIMELFTLSVYTGFVHYSAQSVGRIVRKIEDDTINYDKLNKVIELSQKLDTDDSDELLDRYLNNGYRIKETSIQLNPDFDHERQWINADHPYLDPVHSARLIMTFILVKE